MIQALIRLTAAALFVLLAVVTWRIVSQPVPDPVLPPLTGKIDLIEIDKSDRRMTVYRDGVALRSYDVALGFSPAGDKAQEGDGRTPEGRFRIDRRNPNSKFHLSLGLDYPHAEDIEHAAAYGFSPGGDIFIHGQPNWFPGQLMRGDWTEGCIAVSNVEMEEIWRVADLGTEVVIRP
ncbi:MAG: L,D-transpeptidase family protein [Pseudomonadota bacterium]